MAGARHAGGRYERTVVRWFDHYLKGRRNGVASIAAVTSQKSNSEGPVGWYRGRWPRTRKVRLYAQFIPATRPGQIPWQLMPHKPLHFFGPKPEARFPSLGVNTESHAAHHAPNNHDWFWFESPPLARRMRIFGSIRVQVYSKVFRRWITYTPSVLDVDRRHHTMVAGQHATTDPHQLVAVTRGWLDSRYRKGLAHRRPIKPGENFRMSIRTKPQDYTFKKGHLIGVNIQTEINEWSIPKPYECDSDRCAFVNIDWRNARTRLVLPVVNAPRRVSRLFSGDHHHH